MHEGVSKEREGREDGQTERHVGNKESREGREVRKEEGRESSPPYAELNTDGRTLTSRGPPELGLIESQPGDNGGGGGRRRGGELR